jgi:predicted nucleic acid-binding protein
VLLLDTDILIDVQRGYAPALNWFASLEALPCVPGFVVMELIQDAQNASQLQRTMKLVAPLPVVWPSTADCEKALADFATHRLAHGLGLLDALIAACTTGLSATLCTFNAKHYRAIADLKTLQPYAR